jgi:molybdopterin molybdotransferase
MKPSLRPVPAAEARRMLDGAVSVVEREAVALDEAVGRVLAEPLVAGEDVPPFARSVMDGYAVRASDVATASEGAPVWLSVTGSVAIATPASGAVGPGQAFAIPTGGALPAGADAVVMVEHVELTAGTVGVRRAVEPGRNIIQQGEDIPRGALVLPAGRRCGPSDVAALASFGHATVSVHRRPRVLVLSTGSELCPPAQAPRPGQIRDVNQSALAAQAVAAGALVTRGGIVDDDPAALEAAIRAAAAGHDVVILSGGSSVGGRDHTAEVFERVGELLFHGIAVRPGRPTLAARAGGTLLVGMPGVPTSAIVIFEIFVAPLLRRLGGERELVSPSYPARLLSAYLSEAGREDYLRVRLVDRAGERWAEVLSGGSAALSNVVAAEGLVVVPAEASALAAGQTVQVLPLR